MAPARNVLAHSSRAGGQFLTQDLHKLQGHLRAQGYVEISTASGMELFVLLRIKKINLTAGELCQERAIQLSLSAQATLRKDVDVY
jgi:hypothetical protein